MIKSPKTSSDLDSLAQVFKDEVLSKISIKKGLDGAILNATNLGQMQKAGLYSYLDANLEAILIGRPAALEGLIDRIKPLIKLAIQEQINLTNPPPNKKAKGLIKSTFLKEILSIFDYEKFTQIKNGDWAYSHSRRLDMEVCPYCNMQYTFTVKTMEGKSRPQFDHFIKKSEHPYFALSFFNLVPSCYVCNANFKGQKPFLPSTHIHPFVEGMENTLVFRTNVNKAEFLLGKRGFELTLEMPLGGDVSKTKKAERNSKVFHLHELYKFHKELAGEIILKAFTYTDTKIVEMLEEYPSGSAKTQVFKSKDDIYAMLFGSHIRGEVLYKRSLAKLSYDILKELGINP